MSDQSPSRTHVDALALTAPGCPFCPAVIEALTQLLKGGELRAVELVNAAAAPDRAGALGVRTVPWVRIGPFELEGAQSTASLRGYVARVREGAGIADALREQLAGGALAAAEARVARDPRAAAAVVELVADQEAPLQVRLGAGALLEGLAPTGLEPLIPRLAALTRHDDHRVRADACHYLGLAGSPAVRGVIEPLLGDPSAEVREIAREALDALPAS